MFIAVLDDLVNGVEEIIFIVEPPFCVREVSGFCCCRNKSDQWFSSLGDHYLLSSIGDSPKKFR